MSINVRQNQWLYGPRTYGRTDETAEEIVAVLRQRPVVTQEITDERELNTAVAAIKAGHRVVSAERGDQLELK